MKKILTFFAIILCAINILYAQKKVNTVDTVEMKVLVTALSGEVVSPGLVFDIPRSYYFEKIGFDTVLVEPALISLKNNVNGFFITELLFFWQSLKKNITKLSSFDFLYSNEKNVNQIWLSWNGKQLPLELSTKYGIFRSYSQYTIKGKWLKFTFYDGLENKHYWLGDYLKQVPNSNLKSFTFYVLIDIYSKEYLW